MLKTHRIIPLVFILFFFGFTLITVAPVFAQGQWDKSMGMRHPDRPCMKNAREKGPRFGCGPDMRSPEQIASDPYDTNHPKSQEARANQADSPKKGFSSFGRTPKREVADSPKKGFSSFGRTPEEENQDSSGHFERRLQRKDKLGDSQTRKGKELQRIKEQKEELKKQDDELKWHARNMIGVHAKDRCNSQLRMEQSPLCARVDALYNRLVGCQKNGGSTWEKCFRDGLDSPQMKTCGRYCWCAIEGISESKRHEYDCRAERGAAWREDTIWMMKGYYYSGTYTGNYNKWQYKGGGWSKVKK
jgi:hypothetical protein